jgi:tetratricopeptide (TPR) repeat protein
MNIKIIIFTLPLILFSCSTKKDLIVKEHTSKPLVSNDYYSLAMEKAKQFESSSYSDLNTYRISEDNFIKAISFDQGDADIWFNMGRLYLYGNEYIKAKEAFKNAIKYRKGFIEAYSLLAKTYLEDGDKNGSLNVLLKANETIPNNDVIMNNTALIYILLGDLNQAQRLAELIIKKNPKFVPAYNTLGNVYYFKGKYEYARFIYIKALDEGLENGSIYSNLGVVTAKLEGRSQSYDLLKKGTDLSPNDPYTHLNLGEYLLSSGDNEGAINEFKRTLSLNPRLVEAIVNLASAYSNIGMFLEAKELYEKALQYAPSYPEACFNYGIFLIDNLKKPQEALDMFKRYVALKNGEISPSHRVFKYINDIANQKRDK